MHEYSIVAALIEQVDRCARERGARSVRRLVVSIGELAGVETELLERAYETFRVRTVCDGAALTIRPVPARWACPDCGAEPPPGALLRCPGCGRPARLVSGDEIVLERIEMEVA